MSVPPSGAAKRVLVVDDSLTVRMDLQDALEADGYEVVASGTAADARRAIAEGAFDLAVLDVLLPDGNGVDLLIELRQDPRTAGIPVMMLSIEREVTARIRGLVNGADEYVGKPYDTDYVLERARALVSQQADARPGSPFRDERQRPIVLAVDDSPTYRDALSRALLGAGYDVVTAGSGEEALRKLAAGLQVDAVVLDLLMPGLTGTDTVRRLRMGDAHHGTPVLMLTVREAMEDAVAALDAGADDHVPKSSNFAVLHARLKAHLRRRQLEQEQRGLRAEVERLRLEEREFGEEAARGWAMVAERARAALSGVADPGLAADLDDLQHLSSSPVGPPTVAEAAHVAALAVERAELVVAVDASPVPALRVDAERASDALARIVRGLSALGAPAITIEIRGEDGGVVFRVRAAVDPARVERALVPFAIAEPRAWGLHLAAAARIAVDLGSRLVVASEGPDAVVSLPIA